MRYRLGAALLGLVLVAAPLLAQQEARLDGRVDAATRARLTVVLDSAHAAGLPADPLVNKALEGASKGATGDRIVAAVRRLAADMTRARTALGAASTAELVAGAAAIHGGADPALLNRLRTQRPGASLEVALAVLTDLMARGVPADTATRAVVALVGTRARDAELVAFRRNVEEDIALGAPAAAATVVRLPASAMIVFAQPGVIGSSPSLHQAAAPRRP
ncbi:MAG TPA: hypothetical protein VFW98_14130 [Gemmatimonadaceae bacterium]|nr:hypothetical protein [Gemmatimonadaceae bacterium]